METNALESALYRKGWIPWYRGIYAVNDANITPSVIKQCQGTEIMMYSCSEKEYLYGSRLDMKV